MEIRLLIEPQFGATFEDQVAFVQEAEQLGFPAVMRSDHVLNTSSLPGLPGPTDAWVTLGALGRETDTIRLGTLMTSANFRDPALLALIVAQVDQMSRGRIELGLGAGWFESEHQAFGFPFPAPKDRLNRLEEQLAIITSLWGLQDGETASFAGEHYTIIDNPGLPRPHQSPPPIIVGGGGTVRTPAIAARFASEFNVGLVDPDVVSAQFARVRAACTKQGRDPDDLVYSSATTVCCSDTTQAAHKMVEEAGLGLDDFNTIGVAGTPEQVAKRLLEYRDVGSERFYLRLLDLTDLDQIRRVAAELVPLV